MQPRPRRAILRSNLDHAGSDQRPAPDARTTLCPLRDPRPHWARRHGGSAQGARLAPGAHRGDQVVAGRFERRPRAPGPFAARARAAAALSHPNIASLYDVGEAGEADLEALGAGEYLVPGTGRVPYLVMEFVEGEDLRSRLAKQRLPLGEVVDLGIQIAQGLAAAHKAGIVHRDLKPANVMLSPEGRPKLLDFGLAKMVGNGDSHVSEVREEGPLTREGMIVGTVPYMAPEQLQGARADARSDLFSLGVVLYEMIAGEPPYPTRLAEFFRALAKEPEPLSSSCPFVAPELAQIVHKLLAREPEARYQQAEDVVRELKTLAGGSSGSQEMPSEHRQTVVTAMTRKRRRNRVFGLVAAGVGLLALIGAVLYSIDNRRAHRTEPHFNLAVLPFENQTGDPNQDYFCQGLSRLLIPKLSRIRGVNAIDSDLGADQVLSGLVERLPDGRVGLRLALTRMGAAERQTRTFEGERGEVDRLLFEIDRWLVGRLGIPLSMAEWFDQRRAITRSFEALDHYLQALPYVEKSTAPDLLKASEHLERALEIDPSFALAHAKLGEALWRLYSQFNKDDDTLLSKAEEHAQWAFDLDPEQPEVQIALAQVYRSRGTDRAESLLKNLIWRYPYLAEAHHQLAITFRRARQFCDAKRSSWEAIQIQGKSYRYWNEHGLDLFGMGRYQEASAAFERALELAPQGATPPIINNLISSTVRAGDYEHALAFIKSLATPVNELNLLNSIGASYAYTGHLDEAERYYRQILSLADDSLERLLATMNLGDVYERRERRSEARALYREALDILKSSADLRRLEDDATRLREALLFAKLRECYTAQAKAAEIERQVPEGLDKHQTLARIYALCGQDEAAWTNVEKAVALGVPLKVLNQEFELKNLVERPEFAALASLEGKVSECP
ncbi:MAG: protein kinase [Thermoanaerobaculia bacterium]|nr:protein kinase [Thermoanaerobaculia bacterium]